MTVDMLKKRREVAKATPPMQEVVRGSVVVMKRECGKTNCRCQKGFKHHSVYVSQRHKGKTRMIYVPKDSEIKVKRFINNYRKLKIMLDEISQINIGILTKAKR